MQRKRIILLVFLCCMWIGLSSSFGERLRYPYQFPQGSIHTMHFGDWVLSSEQSTFVVSDLDTHRGQIVSAFLNHEPYNIIENWVPLLNRAPLTGEKLSRLLDSEGELIGIRVFHEVSQIDGLKAVTDFRISFESPHLEIHTLLTNDSAESIRGLNFQQNLFYTQISPQLLRSRLDSHPFIFVQEEGIAHGLLPIDPGARISLKSDYGIILYPAFSLEPGQEKRFTTYWYIDHDGFAFYAMLAHRFGIPMQQVEGSVVDPKGRGMPLVKVGAYEENATTRIALTKTDPQGIFRFLLPEGPYVIKLEDGGFESVVQTEHRFEVIPPVANSLVWGPYLTNLRHDGITIQWKSQVNSASTLLLYDADGTLIQSHEIPQRHAISRITLFDYDLDPDHTIYPDSLYYYEVVLNAGIAPEFRSPRYTFRTMPVNPEQYHFVVYGDTRTYDDLHRIVTLEMLKEDPAFVVHTGDLVNNGNFLPDWDNYFDAKRELAARAAYYPVLGNHEYNSVYYYQAYDLPPGGGDYGKRWYAFEFGPVAFIQLDSCVEGNAPLLNRQTEWLEAQLKAYQSMPFIIVAYHHPIWTNNPNLFGVETEIEKAWRPLFERYGVSVVFNGHIHAYERFERNGVHYITTGGGGAPLDPHTGPQFYPFTKTALTGYLHYVRVDVSPATLDIQVKAIQKVTDPYDTLSVVPHEEILDHLTVSRR